MIQKSFIVALLGVISAIGWVIVRQTQAVWRANQARTQIEIKSQRRLDLNAEIGASRDRGMWRGEAVLHGWKLDYREALAAAREAGKPLMIVYRCIP